MTTKAHEGDGAWRSTSNAVGAALATTAGRRRTLYGVAGLSLVATAIALGGEGVGMARDNAPKILAAIASMTSLIGFIAGPVVVGAQVGVDRANGTLDQHRLAGVAPRSLFWAYLLGPQWCLLLLHPMIALPMAANLAAHHDPTGVAMAAAVCLGVVVAQLVASAWSLSIALALPRASLTPPTNAGAPGFFIALTFGLALPAFLAVAHHRHMDGAIAVAAVLLAAGVARDVGLALRRLERDETPETGAGATLAQVAQRLGLVACVAAVTRPHELFSGAFAQGALAFAVAVVTVWAAEPSRAATFRRWARGESREAAPWALGAAALALAALEFVGMAATRADFAAREVIECALVLGALAFAAIESHRGGTLRQTHAMSLGALLLVGAVLGVIRVALPIVGAAGLASVVDEASPLAVASGPGAAAWSPFVRVALAALVAVAAVRSARRANAAVRAQALAAMNPPPA